MAKSTAVGTILYNPDALKIINSTFTFLRRFYFSRNNFFLFVLNSDSALKFTFYFKLELKNAKKMEHSNL